MDIDSRDSLNRIARRLECAAGMVYAVQTNLEQDAYSGKTFAPALYGAYEYLSEQVTALRSFQRGDEEEPEA